jgi:hypothetical protein
MLHGLPHRDDDKSIMATTLPQPFPSVAKCIVSVYVVRTGEMIDLHRGKNTTP